MAEDLWAKWTAEAPPSSSAGAAPAEIKTVANLAAAYQRQADVDGWASARRDMARLACGSFSATVASRHPSDIVPADLVVWRESICNAGIKTPRVKVPRRPGVRTVNRKVREVLTMFDWAVEAGACPPSVAYGLRCVRPLNARSSLVEAPRTRTGVAAQDVAPVLRRLTLCLADMVRLQWRTGMRSGELCCLRWADVNTASDIWLYTPEAYKGVDSEDYRPRVVALGPGAQRLLARYRGAEAYIFSPAESEAQRLAARHDRRETPLSCGNRPGKNRREDPKKLPGDQWTADAYGKAVRKAVGQAHRAGEISRQWTPHELRHGVGTRVRSLMGLDAAGAYLGHKDIETTKIYADLDVRKAIEVARAIG